MQLIQGEKPSFASPVYVMPPTKYGVLVIDDEESVRGVLRIVLRQQGFTVWSAADGQEAIELYRCQALNIHLVLLDVRMPGKDGPQTLAALQQINPHLRCCFMSGDMGNYTAEGLLALGAVAFFRKPFRLHEVAQELRVLASNVA